MNRRMLLLAGVGAALGGAGALTWLISPARSRVRWSPPYKGGERWVSLSPPITESMFAMGAGSALVGRTSACTLPVAASALRDVGSSGAPDVVALAALQPTGIVAEPGFDPELSSIAEVLELPWTSLDDAVDSIARLGVQFGVDDRAAALATAFRARLGGEPPPDAPRVLILLPPGADAADPLVPFVARHTLRGRAMAAAGLRNAVDRDVGGVPRIAWGDLAALDPDIVLVLDREAQTEARRRAVLQPVEAVEGLRAVAARQVDVIGGPAVLSRGPSLLSLPDVLRTRTEQLRAG